MAESKSSPSPATRVLLVEDSEHDRRFVHRLLEQAKEDYEVTECKEGKSALERLQREQFDLLIVDLNMPGMDGMELIRRAQPVLEDTGVMILTGSRSLDAVTEAVRLQVMDYILKEPREALRDTLARQVRSAVRQVHLVRENRRLGQELRLRLARLEQIYQQMPDAVFATIGGDQKLTEINSQARGLLGLPDDFNPVGRTIGEVLSLFSDELSELVQDKLKTNLNVENLYFETSTPDKGERIFLINLTRVVDEKTPSGVGDSPWILALRDVTPSRPDELQEGGFSFHGFVGKDPRILDIYDLVRRVAPLPTSVLVTGATGTGKEVIARAIHSESGRSRKQFVPVNCTALSREILESELFGHVRGAFTGAISSRKGRFREADGGTLFLDEIGDTAESFQTKLLRALETGEIEPVGQDRPICVDVRVICASNQNLERLVREGRFREDLYYRINVVEIKIPSLAERPGDLPLLLETFLKEFNLKFKKSIQVISPGAMRSLAQHDWPGNVRELRHVLEYAFVVADGPTITRSDLPEAIVTRRPSRRLVPLSDFVPSGSKDSTDRGLHDSQAEEISRIRGALVESGGSVGKAAENLHIHRTTLWRKMRQFDIKLGVT